MHKKKIINVASVPQRSPFRYPGGKTWLVPYVRAWLKTLSTKPNNFIEPFAGGGIVSLTVAFESLALNVIMVELDDDVAAVWKAILGEDADWLAERIASFDVTVESAKEELAKKPRSLREKAFQTILSNRVRHGGIMAHGSSFIRFGENGKGIKSRWYPATLRKRILNIADIKDRFQFIQGDGMVVISQHLKEAEAVYFIDPPYTAAGKRAGTRLYKHNALDHAKLFELMGRVKGDFLMTYDNADGVLNMAKKHGFDTELIAMKNTHHAEMTELVIGRNLEWVRQGEQSKKEKLLFDDLE